MLVQKAEAELGKHFFDYCHENKLTSTEAMMILAGMLHMALKWKLRRERHPNDPDAPADIE